jgi:hypothetical protein
MATNPEISAKAGQALGLPSGFKVYSPFPFKGMNWQDAPHAMDDHEFYWIENFVRLGNGRLRTLGDKGSPVYTAPTGTTIVYFEFYTLGTSYYCAIFLSDGSAIQLNMVTLAQTTIGPAGTFYNASTGYKPFAKQWGSIYLLICNRNTTNDYWAWDGSLLYTAGTAVPQGVNIASAGFSYSSTPTVTAFGGSGSGMTFSTLVNNGGIAEINITNPGTGYQPGDIVQLAFSGGGSDTSAILEAVLSAGSVGGRVYHSTRLRLYLGNCHFQRADFRHNRDRHADHQHRQRHELYQSCRRLWLHHSTLGDVLRWRWKRRGSDCRGVSRCSCFSHHNKRRDRIYLRTHDCIWRSRHRRISYSRHYGCG